MMPETLRRAVLPGIALALALSNAAAAGEYRLTIDRVTVDTGTFSRSGVGFNGASPGPVLRFKEGEDVTIEVTNNLAETSSIHWHGLILPFQQDGVPEISYPGIKAGETFTYKFPIIQSGTYWFHSHSGFQEPDGAYGAIVIEPKGREPFAYDREYVIQLAETHPHTGERIFRNLKMMPDYYNRQQRTVFDFVKDTKKTGLEATLADRRMWGEMRMMPTDVEDLQGFAPVINGKSPKQNWTGIFKKGERIRLRFINSSAMTYYDIRIPGLKMTVVQSDGNNIQPVTVDEFRIAVAETYDVIVRPTEDIAYSILAESMARTAMGRATLAPRQGMSAEIPELRAPPRLTMADMSGDPNMKHDMGGMNHGGGGSAGGHKMPDGTVMKDAMPRQDGAMKPGDDGKMAGGGHKMPDGTVMKGMMTKADAFYAAGSGLVPAAANGGKFLSYSDLRAQKPLYPFRETTREIELRLTGNMERYIWSINGVKYEDAEPIRLRYGERVRFKFVNTTMMTHPMHLHGMWSILDVGKGKWNPAKHTVSVAPGTTVYMEVEVDAPGQWAFHCHLSYHMDSGMFRKIIVEGGPKDKEASLNSNAGG